MFVFTVLCRFFEDGRETRDRKTIRFATLSAAEAARKFWESESQKVSPIVMIRGGAK